VVTAILAAHIAFAMTRPLPPEVEVKAKAHILDTVAAMVSGTRLAAGLKAIAYARATAGKPECQIIGAPVRTGLVDAAMLNGMLAHADETDDSHAPSLTHPGCAVVPAALAAGELRRASGRDVLRAVVAGYDVGTRLSMALGGEEFFKQHHSSHALGGLFGAAAAAGTLFGLGQDQCACLLGYAVQTASGNASWRRDPDHIEKAFDFGGMPAMNGTLAAHMVAHGFTGVRDALEGVPGLFSAFPKTCDPALAVKDLGVEFEIMRTAIKKWCVGSPIQAALDALEMLMADHGVRAEGLREIEVLLPSTSARVVDDRAMPDVNLQHQLAMMLVDGTVTFASTHDHDRMRDPAVLARKALIRLTPCDDAEFQAFPRQAILRASLLDGRRLTQRVRHVRGTPGNPMTQEEIVAKARDLMVPILGVSGTEATIGRILDLEREESLEALLSQLGRTAAVGEEVGHVRR